MLCVRVQKLITAIIHDLLFAPAVELKERIEAWKNAKSNALSAPGRSDASMSDSWKSNQMSECGN